ncbi:MAG: hypothetical protein RQ856_00280 [Candidatus Izemoplasmatales bacterium]|nr:hypothetical protein [Candidatus Izemoplasmatales bacterium]
MSRIKEFQGKMKQRTKFEIIKSLFQAVTVTVVAVVAVTVFIPSSPKARFDEVKAFSHEIIYQVSVTDQDLVVEDNQLKLVLESQFERIEQWISIGQNYGSFSELDQNTQYSLKVVFDKGFGEEVLAKETVTTSNDLVAAISSISISPNSLYYEPIYDIGISYGNIENYSNFQIRYATIYQDFEQEIFYDTYVLTMLENNVEMQFYDSSHVEFVIILEAMLDGEWVILDEVRFAPPFSVDAYVYLSSYNDSEAHFNVYVEGSSNVEILYQMEVYLNDYLVNKVDYIPSANVEQHGNEFVISGLKPDSDYTFSMKAWYTNPETLREEHVLIGEAFIHTLPSFIYEIEVVEYTTYYEVFITTNSSELNQAFYEIYYYESEFWYYYLAGTSALVSDGENYTTSFIIDKVIFEEFYIDIGIESSVNYQEIKIIRRIES